MENNIKDDIISVLLIFSYNYRHKNICLDITKIKKYMIDSNNETDYFASFANIIFNMNEEEFLLNLKNNKDNKIQIAILNYIFKL